MSPGFKKRLALFAFIGLGVVLWRSGFGFLPSEHTVVWQLPVAYSEVRSVDLQVWDGELLLTRAERTFPGGVSEELRSTVTVARGAKRGLAAVTFADGGSQAFVAEFDPGNEATVVVRPARR